MIIARITMGMGNQMFQYAAALALSIEKDTELKVDINSYSAYQLRQYELHKYFQVNAAVASQDEIKKYAYDHPVKKICNRIFPNNKIRYIPYEEKFIQRNLLAVFDFFSPSYRRKTFYERHFHYDKYFFSTGSDVYLLGYWMSWKYFDKYQKQIRECFTVCDEIVASVKDDVDVIKKINAVAVHIRRTDFLDPHIAKLKGVISSEYYRQAIDLICSKEKDPVFYFFSDDMEWVKNNLQFKELKVVHAGKNKSAIEDFYLMTQCSHNIIAHSSFSWWAAYLNSNKNKIVVAPEHWYSKAAHYNDKDVYPAEWIKISS